MLGLGTPATKNDPNAWRPSKAARGREQDNAAEARADWRPSKVNEERLSSFSPSRPRPGFRIPRGLRPLITFVLFIALLYVIGKLWFEPELGELRPALAAVIGAMVAIIVASVPVARMRRQRKRGDDKSTLRL